MAADLESADKSLAIISEKIHKSLISTVIANGGDDDPIILWNKINNLGSSKKESNVFRAYREFNTIKIDPSDLSGSILKYRDAIAQLEALDLTLDYRQMAHQILNQLPPLLSQIKDSVISSGNSPNVVTYKVVLDLIDSKARTMPVKSDPPINNYGNVTAMLKQPTKYNCLPGHHHPLANYPEDRCFKLHPHLRNQFYNRSKTKAVPQAHFLQANNPSSSNSHAFNSQLESAPSNITLQPTAYFNGQLY